MLDLEDNSLGPSIKAALKKALQKNERLEVQREKREEEIARERGLPTNNKDRDEM